MARIFDHSGRTIAEIEHVICGEVLRAGALVITYGGRARPIRRVQAPGTWSSVDDWYDDDERSAERGGTTYAASPPSGDPYDRLSVPAEPDASDATQLIHPPDDRAGLDTGPRHAPAAASWAAIGARNLVRPLPPGPPAPVLPVDGMSMPDGARLAAALLIPCTCDERRCPHVLNPSTPAERQAWADRQRGVSVGPDVADGLLWPQPEPLQRCIHERGHDPHVEPHDWKEYGWPYGIVFHHPSCPRWHERWNAPFGEGQPALLAPVGATPEPAELLDDEPVPPPVPAGVDGLALGRAQYPRAG